MVLRRTRAWWTQSSKRAELPLRAGLPLLLALLLPLACTTTGGGRGGAGGGGTPSGGEDSGPPLQDLGAVDALSPQSDLALDADPDPQPDLASADQGAPDLGPPDLGPPDEGDFTLATYNVHDLFDTVDDPNEDEVLSAAQLARKFEQLAAVLRDVDADVVALQEVENLALLQALFDGRLADMGYHELRLIEADHIRGIDVAVASRLPLEFVITHQNDRWRDGDRSFYFNPDCLEVRLVVGRQRVVIFINHLISKRGGAEADEVRYAVASRLRFLVDSTQRLLPGAWVALVGDFNDTPDSPTLANARGGPPDALVDLTTLVPFDERYTYTYGGDRQMLDYILVTPDMARQALRSSTRIVHTADSRDASDHSPVVTRFRWGG